MSRERIQRIQDPVHGLMEFQGMETSVVEVLRAQELQRMRRVRQLGLAHLVFPGAEHSRLVHSIGAAHLAVRFCRHLREATRDVLVPFLRPTDSVARDVALAALCHDLGHGPLSHLWEREVVGEEFDRIAWLRAFGLSEDEGLEGLKWHELAGQALLAWPDGELHRILEQQEAGSSLRVRRLLAGSYYLPYLSRLLSSDIDVDRCDFILRDALQTGVAYGRYDLDWLVSTATVGRDSSGTLVIGFDSRKAPRVVEQFLIARRALYDTVYYHKTVRCAEGMVGLLFRRFKEVVRTAGWPLPEIGIFDPLRRVIEGQPIEPRAAIGLDDYLLWVFIQQLAAGTSKDRTTTDLAQRIIARDLFKQVPCSPERLQQFLVRDGSHQRLHDTAAKFVTGVSSYYVYIDDATLKMFEEDAKSQGYLISMPGRRAAPIREHPQLRVHWQPRETRYRLFAPGEAIEALSKLVGAR